jgi:hypothetical protein
LDPHTGVTLSLGRCFTRHCNPRLRFALSLSRSVLHSLHTLKPVARHNFSRPTVGGSPPVSARVV